MSSSSARFWVTYKVAGWLDEQRVGPYRGEAAALDHARDIRGFVGVSDVRVLPAASPPPVYVVERVVAGKDGAALGAHLEPLDAIEQAEAVSRARPREAGSGFEITYYVATYVGDYLVERWECDGFLEGPAEDGPLWFPCKTGGDPGRPSRVAHPSVRSFDPRELLAGESKKERATRVAELAMAVAADTRG